MATGLRWARRYVETDRNISDGDSRLADRWALLPGQRLCGRQLEATSLAAAVPPEWLENRANIVDENDIRAFDDVEDADFTATRIDVRARRPLRRQRNDRRAAARAFRVGRCGPRLKAGCTEGDGCLLLC